MGGGGKTSARSFWELAMKNENAAIGTCSCACAHACGNQQSQLCTCSDRRLFVERRMGAPREACRLRDPCACVGPGPRARSDGLAVPIKPDPPLLARVRMSTAKSAFSPVAASRPTGGAALPPSPSHSSASRSECSDGPEEPDAPSWELPDPTAALMGIRLAQSHREAVFAIAIGEEDAVLGRVADGCVRGGALSAFLCCVSTAYPFLFIPRPKVGL